MAYAIIETGGKQLWAEPGRFYDVELLSAAENDTLDITQVLLVHDGQQAHVGQPYVQDAVVKARILSHFRGPKVIVYKMRPKKKTRKKNWHRQELTRLMIESIQFRDQVLGAESAQAAEAVAG
ncbi:MAG: 50S ribosomal protein L21 [Thermostichales cyanobacterium DRC_bins_46]